MALIDCKECGEQISDTSKFCPHCGAPYHQSVGLSSANRTGKLFASIAIIIIGIIMMIWANTRPSPDYMSYGLADEYYDTIQNLTNYGMIAIGVGIFALMFALKSKTKD